ncbi:LLM class flavin-dependent oxidoreductase [Streptomyces hirsutus]|uniref:LLM class flavin-dependent oxidoreductase n=1 Tax=Streptomyces hirsutus TaxID=35620 RepID=UPI00332325E4
MSPVLSPVPSPVPSSVQRTPVIYQAGTSPAGRASAAKHAEGVFMSGRRPDVLRPHSDDIRARAARLGRARRASRCSPS